VTIAAVNYTWYGARAGGILAFALLTAGVVVGLLLSSRARLEGWPRFALEDVHRFLGILTGTFLVLHVGFLLVDSYVPFSLTNLLVPGTAPYRPISVAAGVIAAELLVALAVANHYRTSLSYRFWRRTHYLNFAVWLLAFVHGIVSGTDTTTAWGSALYLSAAAVVAGLAAVRVASALTVQAGRAPVR
jgi:sulfoxide reductase heme-binding subunit YedZ